MKLERAGSASSALLWNFLLEALDPPEARGDFELVVISMGHVCECWRGRQSSLSGRWPQPGPSLAPRGQAILLCLILFWLLCLLSTRKDSKVCLWGHHQASPSPMPVICKREVKFHSLILPASWKCEELCPDWSTWPLRAAPCPVQRVSSVSRVLLPSLPLSLSGAVGFPSHAESPHWPPPPHVFPPLVSQDLGLPQGPSQGCCILLFITWVSQL